MMTVKLGGKHGFRRIEENKSNRSSDKWSKRGGEGREEEYEFDGFRGFQNKREIGLHLYHLDSVLPGQCI
jgi:hypothetical protein